MTNPGTRTAHVLARLSGLSLHLARKHPVRRILMMHGVGGPELPVRNFERIMAWVATHFKVVPLNQLVAGTAANIPADGEVALTFDDGLVNHARLAYPILSRLNLPATFFVCPGLVERREWLWNHEARARLNRMTPNEISRFAVPVGGPTTGTEPIIDWMKTLPLERREVVSQALRETTPQFVPTDAERLRYDPMDWDELRALNPALITIGSHTVNHPILPTLDDQTIAHELSASRAELENRLDRVVEYFCYPNGSGDARVRQAASRYYRAAVTTEPGYVATYADLSALPRIGVPPSRAELAWRMWRI